MKRAVLLSPLSDWCLLKSSQPSLQDRLRQDDTDGGSELPPAESYLLRGQRSIYLYHEIDESQMMESRRVFLVVLTALPGK